MLEDVPPTYAHRTGRFERVVHHLGLALGGRPAAGLARRLLMPVSRDTLLRTVRRHAVRVFEYTDHHRDRRLGLEAGATIRHGDL
jgi:hypothetical protein